MLKILQGDWISVLATLPDQSVHCCVTSPPYWGLRDYGVTGQLGLEKTPDEYVAKIVEGFREVRRVLRDDGTLWLNLGDSYYNYRPGLGQALVKQTVARTGQDLPQTCARRANQIDGLKEKDLVGIPWRVAFALQADGWYLRSDIIWHKPNPMPESVTDRPTKAHEYIFLLTKNERYFYDAEAIKERYTESTVERMNYSAIPKNGKSTLNVMVGGEGNRLASGISRTTAGLVSHEAKDNGGRNKRTVWTVPSQAYPESHFATFPEDLIKPCILAGTSAKGCCPKCGAPWERFLQKQSFGKDDYSGKYSKEYPNSAGRNVLASVKAARAAGGPHENPFPPPKTLGWQPTCTCGESTVQPCMVVDPFAGSGTTGQVALELGRKAILIELNPKYVELMRQRTSVTPGLPLA